MADATVPLPLRIGLPEPLGRRMRLGPFPTARHALKFAAFAAVGGTVAAGAGAVWSIPFLVAGLACSTVAGEAGPVDERARRFLAYQWRRRRGASAEPSAGPRTPVLGGIAPVGDHRIAVLVTSGVPVAFLPPEDARGLFDSFRSLLREVDHGLLIQAAGEPLSGKPFVPPVRPADEAAPDRAARQGYAELVRLLCQRRYRRRVLLVVWERDGPGAIERLERAAGRLSDGLGRLGLTAIRLEREALGRALVELGWTAAGPA